MTGTCGPLTSGRWFSRALHGYLGSLDSLDQKAYLATFSIVILTMKKKSASTYIDDDIGIVQCFDARNKREVPTERTLLPQTSLKKKNKKPPMHNCQVLTWVSHSEKNRYIDFFFPLWFLINLTNKTQADFNGDFIDPVLFCPH